MPVLKLLLVYVWNGSASCVHNTVNMVAVFSGPGQFTITSVSIGADNDHINVTYMQVSHVTIYDKLSTYLVRAMKLPLHAPSL